MPGPVDSPTVVEFRQYTMRPGWRDEFIELFDRVFVDAFEEVGMIALGQFRDLGDPDRFVWLRGFPDLPGRQRSLTTFYDGPVWTAHREQANAALVDWTDARLMRPLPAAAGLVVRSAGRPPIGASAPDSLVVATLWSFPPSSQVGTDLVAGSLVPVLRKTGPAPLAVLSTMAVENNYPRLPVRTGENVVAILCTYPDDAAYREHLTAAQADPVLRDEVLPTIARVQSEPPQVLRLAPTGRSLIR